MAKTAYVVTAPTEVLGNEPGAQFEADLDPVQEARLLESGALELVKGDQPAEKPKSPPAK